MISGYKSIKTLISKLYRDLNINTELPEDSIIEWVAEALNIIGAFSQYDSISDCLELVNGKAKLPCNFYKLVDITYKNKPLYWSSNSVATNYGCHNCQIPTHNSNNCGHTFYLNNSYLITSLDSTDTDGVCIVYLGMPVDEEGFPMIPDDVMYDKALTAYVVYMLDKAEWRKGKITDKVKADSEADWLFYVNSARGAANMPSTAQLEGLKNTMQRLMARPNMYKVSFKGLSKPENLNL